MSVHFVDDGERWGLRPTFLSMRGHANSWRVEDPTTSVPSAFIVEHILSNSCVLVEADELGFCVYEFEMCCEQRILFRARKMSDGTYQVLEFGANVTDDLPTYEEDE